MPSLYNYQCNVHIILYVARVAAIRLYNLARPVLVTAGAELLMEAHSFVDNLSMRAQARLSELVNEVWVALEHGDMPRVTFVGRRVVRLSGEVLLLRLLSHLLERARLAWTDDRD